MKTKEPIRKLFYIYTSFEFQEPLYQIPNKYFSSYKLTVLPLLTHHTIYRVSTKDCPYIKCKYILILHNKNCERQCEMICFSFEMYKFNMGSTCSSACISSVTHFLPSALQNFWDDCSTCNCNSFLVNPIVTLVLKHRPYLWCNPIDKKK